MSYEDRESECRRWCEANGVTISEDAGRVAVTKGDLSAASGGWKVLLNQDGARILNNAGQLVLSNGLCDAVEELKKKSHA
jgi:hypothetical protein